ncbi:MAG: GNAT family N-acetyltransferase [Candidatus Thorarchaeota archaeon]|nr:GNAT family N-acetyltransferase [Candidatus Thorarchaeota archaeon]
MQNISSELYHVTKRDIKKVIETLARAFSEDHLMCYFAPDPERRLRFLPRYFNYRIRNTLIDGNIYATSEDIEGVVFLTQTEYKSTYSLPRAMRTGGLGLYRVAGSENVRKMREVERFVSDKRDECISEQYLYLGSLAVHPDYQGKGLASKLIRPILEACHSHNRLCVLDAEDESLVQMYEHFGFEVVDSYILPDANIQHWIMAKRP